MSIVTIVTILLLLPLPIVPFSGNVCLKYMSADVISLLIEKGVAPDMEVYIDGLFYATNEACQCIIFYKVFSAAMRYSESAKTTIKTSCDNKAKERCANICWKLSGETQDMPEILRSCDEDHCRKITEYAVSYVCPLKPQELAGICLRDPSNICCLKDRTCECPFVYENGTIKEEYL